MQMNEFPAFFTLTVKAGIRLRSFVLTYIFKTGRGIAINHIFLQNPLVDEQLQLSVNGRKTDGSAFRL